MNAPAPAAARRHRRRRLLLLLGLSIALAVPGTAVAQARGTYVQTATYRYTAIASGTGSASRPVSATASYGTPAVHRTRTGTASVVRRAAATKTSVARARVTAASPARANTLAAAKAKATAMRIAKAGAAALARSRATAAARAALPATATSVWRMLYRQALADAKYAAVPAGSATRGTGTACGSTIYKSSGAPWTCTFDDEFAGTTLDTSKWMYATTAHTGLYTGAADTSNGCFTDSGANVYVADGALHLVARRESSPIPCHLLGGQSWPTTYTAGQVASKDHFSQTYGRFEVRAKFPSVTVAGLHSGLWMWPQDNSKQVDKLGEIDIVEWYSQYPAMVMPSTHYSFDQADVDLTGRTHVNNATTWNCTIATASSAFHTYAVEWSPSRITFSYDGTVCLINAPRPSDRSPFDQPYFLALTQAFGLGGNAPTGATALPAATQVDWVRVWK